MGNGYDKIPLYVSMTLLKNKSNKFFLTKSSFVSPTLHCMKINSELIKDLNARPEILKQLDDNIGKSLLDVGIGPTFL